MKTRLIRVAVASLTVLVVILSLVFENVVPIHYRGSDSNEVWTTYYGDRYHIVDVKGWPFSYQCRDETLGSWSRWDSEYWPTDKLHKEGFHPSHLAANVLVGIFMVVCVAAVMESWRKKIRPIRLNTLPR